MDSKSALQMPSSPVKTTESSVAIRKSLQDEPDEIRGMHAVHNHHQSRSRCARCGRQKESVNSDGGSCSFCRSHVITQPPKDELSIVTVEPIYDVTTSISNDLYDDTYCRNGKATSNYSPSESQSLGRKWRHFAGKNKFYCEGRIMTAPSIRFCVLSFGLIIVTFVLFIIFDGPFLAARLTLAIPIVGALLFLSVVVNMLKTSCSDPGILPRASQQESEYIEKSYGDANNSRPPPRTKDIVVNGQTVKSKYCFTCKMFRPPRASHCGVCDNCVDRFDHHCPFLGNCIGKRNYRSFYAFIVSLSLLAVFVLSCSITHLALLSKDTGNFLDALRETPTSAVVVLISFFGMWTVIGLAGFHTYLIAMEQTTNEDIKGMFGRANSKNPYSRGNFCQNCCFVLCGPAHPSLIDPRGYATLDFLASLPKVSDSTGTSTSNNKATTSIKTHCTETRSASQTQGQSQPGAVHNQMTTPGGGQFNKGVPTSPTSTIPNTNGKMLSPHHSAPPAPLNTATSGVFSGKFPMYLREPRPKGRNHIESTPTVIHQPSSSMVTVVDMDSHQNRRSYNTNTGHHMSFEHGISNGNLSGSASSSGSSICEHSQNGGQGHGHVSLSMVKLDFDTPRRTRDGTSTSSSGTHVRDSGSMESSAPSTSFQNHQTNNTKDSCPHTTKSKQNRPAINHGGRLENMTMINSPLHLDTIM